MIKLKSKVNWKKVGQFLGGDCYQWGDVKVIVNKEMGLWHLSISLSYRYPTWDEIYTAWYDLIPDAQSIRGALILPPKTEYVNVHANCFHIHQLQDAELPATLVL